MGTLYQSSEQRKYARRNANDQAQAMAKLEAEAADREKQQIAVEERERARAIQKTLRSNSGGRSSTILTSPLGIPGTAGTPNDRKTLLGL